MPQITTCRNCGQECAEGAGACTRCGRLLDSGSGPLSLLDRMLRASLLESRVYKEVSQARGTTLQSMLVLLLTALARGVGRLGTEEAEWVVFVEGFLLGLVWWVVFTMVSYILANLIQTEPDDRPGQAQMARLTAFAQAPGALWVLGLLPRIGIAATNVVGLWQLAAIAVAVQHGLDDRSVWKATLIVAAGFAAWLVVLAIFQS